ncbi:MAG: pilus assembly protein PilM, partial [Candidatus Omnitrophica bacterium]|nr:pilus assembly protein PilM [Candidatus Omnitrophota bacterium]
MKFAGKSKDKTAIGLDIGSAVIKAVKIRSSNGAFELVDFMTESALPDPGASLKKIKEAKGLEGVNISLSGASTVIRYVAFPRMSPQELKQALKFEAQKHIPFAVSEANLDGFILKNDLADNKMLILLAAAKKESVNQRIKLLTDSGLKANLIDLDSLALYNCFSSNYSKEDLKEHKTIALLNIGSEISSLNIADDGILRLSRDIHFGTSNIVPKIEVSLGNLANEIRVSFDFFESQNASTATRIFLSGGGAGFQGLKEALAGLLGIEV